MVGQPGFWMNRSFLILILLISCSSPKPVVSLPPTSNDATRVPVIEIKINLEEPTSDPLPFVQPPPPEELKPPLKIPEIKLVWPGKGTISSGFGVRQGKFHYGIDITKDNGKRIVAAASGIVIFARRKGNYGNVVVIDHGNKIRTLYAHTSKMYVREKMKVRAGQLIARIGATGKTKGPHLHFEVWIGRKRHNPLKFLPVR